MFNSPPCTTIQVLRRPPGGFQMALPVFGKNQKHLSKVSDTSSRLSTWGSKPPQTHFSYTTVLNADTKKAAAKNACLTSVQPAGKICGHYPSCDSIITWSSKTFHAELCSPIHIVLLFLRKKAQSTSVTLVTNN